jgi:predicted acetyltransferase
MAAIARQDGVQFAYEFRGDELETVLKVIDPTRFLVALDGERVIGCSGEYELNFTVPGGAICDMPSVTWVSVAPSHTERGVLRSLMHAQLLRYREEGALASALTASEGGIYERFGFGAATLVRGIEIDPQKAVFRRPIDASSVWIATPEQARVALPQIHERWRRQFPGGIHRSQSRWDNIFAAAEQGGTHTMYLLHPDGYVAFTALMGFEERMPRNIATITQYAAATAEAHAALWKTLLSMKLYSCVESRMMPVDDPIEHLLVDARQVRTRWVSEHTWVRPIDVPALLAARTYAVEFEAVWELRDELLGDVRYRVKAGPEGAEAVPTRDTPDLVSDIAALGALYLGGFRLQSFVAGGRAVVDDEELLRRVDRALLADRAPFDGTSY